MYKKTKNKGFTLIELMVVMSIISLLSSIVLVTLNNVKNKAKDAVIKQELRELVNLAYLIHPEYQNGYDNMQGVSVGDNYSGTCDFPPSNYKTQADSICEKISSLNSDTGSDGGSLKYTFLAGAYTGPNPPGPFLRTNYFSFTAWLPGAQDFVCMGISGNSISSSWDGGSLGSALIGCYNNP